MTRELLTIAQLAEQLNCSRRCVEQWLADGRLQRAGLIEANRIGHRRFFDAGSVDVALWRRRVGGLRRVS